MDLNIIIAGERGRIRRIPCTRAKLVLAASLTSLAFLSLVAVSIVTVTYYARHHQSISRLGELEQQLTSQKQKMERERRSLRAQINDLEREKTELALSYEEEKDVLLGNALERLNRRSEIMGEVITTIGIKLDDSSDESMADKGGPFIAAPSEENSELIEKADKYLAMVSTLPFGRPINGRITSGFGKRVDPINKKIAFHEGMDFKGQIGDEIYATADGVVLRAFRNGGYGNYVQIEHGNGYKTSFSHMKKILVKKGQKIKRGQVVGTIGTTGRSTGPHLHYEISLDNKPINPKKFVMVAEKISAP